MKYEHPHYGIKGKDAPDFDGVSWQVNTDTADGTLSLADINEPCIFLYFYQDWCPGCHSYGFPAVVRIKDELEARFGRAEMPVRFIAIQTVFEGHDVNTAERAVKSVERHHLVDIAVGHDSRHPPAMMAAYKSRGTPWSVLIGPDRKVISNGFHTDIDYVIEDLVGALETTPDS